MATMKKKKKKSWHEESNNKRRWRNMARINENGISAWRGEMAEISAHHGNDISIAGKQQISGEILRSV